MNRKEIIRLRLSNQALSGNHFSEPGEVVAHFGAMQAQDYSMALWAVGVRLKNPDRSAIETLINSGEIIRTHILRPTWHLVHKKDVRWMMALSAPNVKKATQYVDKSEGLTDVLFRKTWKIIEQQFINVDHLSKEDIISCLSRQHIIVSNLLATQIIIRAELDMLLCSGEKKGTYALFEKRIPGTPTISRSEAIIKLTGLYFSSRGPATLKDFAWWSGLTISDAKTGVAALSRNLDRFSFNELTYYHLDSTPNISTKKSSALLPCYDEYTVGYSDGRSMVLPDDVDSSKTGNGIFKPLVLYRNEIVGTWKKGKKSPFVEVQPFSDNSEITIGDIREQVEKFKIFIV